MSLKATIISAIFLLSSAPAWATFFPEESEGVIYGEEVAVGLPLMELLFQDLEPFLDLPMRYPTYEHFSADRQTAVAIQSRGRRIVLYGPRAARKILKPVMGVIIQHEYCHHDLRHSGRGSAASEAQSDCCAAQHLASIGELNALDEVTKFTEEQGCRYDNKTPLSDIRASHPCGEQRAFVYQYCAVNNIKQLSQEFLDSAFPL